MAFALKLLGSWNRIRFQSHFHKPESCRFFDIPKTWLLVQVFHVYIRPIKLHEMFSLSYLMRDSSSILDSWVLISPLIPTLSCVHQFLKKIIIIIGTRAFSRLFVWYLRATSHTILRAHDHNTSSTLIGGKGAAGPSSLHTTLEGPTEYVNAWWM